MSCGVAGWHPCWCVAYLMIDRGSVQVAWKGGNPWHNRAAVDAQATCTTRSGKLFEQPVHAVHAFTVAWPPPPPPPQVCLKFQLF